MGCGCGKKYVAPNVSQQRSASVPVPPQVQSGTFIGSTKKTTAQSQMIPYKMGKPGTMIRRQV